MTEISSYDLYRGVEGNPHVNKPAPNFTLLDGDAQQFKLSDHRGKNVVLAFYPADWSPVCKNEFALFQEALDEIHAYNAEIVGISVDSHYSHRAWADHLHITSPFHCSAISGRMAPLPSATACSRRVTGSPGVLCSSSMGRACSVKCGLPRTSRLRPASA